jgi:pimeloyl-ACP methyl ester carboxylesterase
MRVNSSRTGKGCFARVLLGVALVAGSILVLCILGAAFQTVATYRDSRLFQPQGTLYEVNGHSIHLVCEGNGEPAVVLEAGGAANSLWWYRVQEALAQRVKVCAYDRAGQGFSEPAEGPRDAGTLTEDLYQLLAQADVSSPRVIVGHSYGAIWARIFAARYVGEVAGLVLVDSTFLDPPRFADETGFRSWKASIDPFKVLEWAAYRVGIIRLTAPSAYRRSGYPPELAQEIAALQSRNATFDTDYAEQIASRLQLTEESARAEDLGSLPVLVVWAGSSPTAQTFFAPFRTQTEQYSSNTRSLTIDGADHGSVLGDPAYASDLANAILDLIEAVPLGSAGPAR